MTLRIVMGAAGTGKTTLVIDEVATALNEQPLGKPLVIITPEQATFLTEFQLASHSLVGGSLRAEVLSFASLYKRLAKELRVKKQPWLDSQGKTMLIADILGKRSADLKVLNKIAQYQSTAEDVLKLIDEFGEYQISPQMLILAGEKIDNPLIKGKLDDLALIYEDLLKKTDKAYLDEAKMLGELPELLAKSSLYKDTEFWFDGYVEFTPAQLDVVNAVLKVAKKVTITLPLTTDEEDVFAKSIKTKNKLVRLAKGENIPVIFDSLLKNYRQKDAKDLLAIEQAFRKEKFSLCDFEAENVEIFYGQNPQEEVESAAQIIVKLCQEGYEYKDFAIITRSLLDYSGLIEKTFDDYKISYYMDKSTSLQSHPVVNLLLSALDVVGENWSSAAVMSYLKSGLSPVSMSKVDILENYALKNGIKGKMWQYPERWCRGGKIEYIKKSAGIAIAPILDFSEKLSNLEEKTVSDFSNALCEFMQRLKVENKLGFWSEEAKNRGDFDAVQKNEQVLVQLNTLFGQLNDFLGVEVCTAQKFKELLLTGINSMNINTVPLALDQVSVVEISRSRLPEVKVAIVLGMNDGEFPAAIPEDGLFGSLERDVLEKAGLVLEQSQRSEQFTEKYYIYTSVTRASEKLFVGYHKTDEDTAKASQSLEIANLKALFKDLKDVACLNQYMCLAGDKSKIVAMSKHLLQVKDDVVTSVKEVDFWQNTYSEINENIELETEFSALKKSINYTVHNNNISKVILDKLYKNLYKTSVSRIETFNSCPMKYYANYGINIRPRDEFSLKVMDIGSLYHYVLAEIIKDLTDENCIWSELKAAEVEPLVVKKIDEFAVLGMADLFSESGKNEYAKSKILAIVTQNVLDMAEILAQGEFKPVAFELDFGLEKNMHKIADDLHKTDGEFALPSLKLSVDDDVKVELRGQIDRVDMAEGANSKYVRIVDYKMRNKTLELGDVYYGINWQMPLYMEALLNGYNGKAKDDANKKLSPAGMFYVPVQDFVDGGLEGDQFAGLKLQGLAILNKEALLLAEREFGDGYKSRTMKVQLKKDGEFSKNSQGLTEKQYKMMNNFLEKELIKRVSSIVNGEICQKPMHNGTYSSCEFCDYYAICATDLSVEKNEVVAKKMSIDEFFDAIMVNEMDNNTYLASKICINKVGDDK